MLALLQFIVIELIYNDIDADRQLLMRQIHKLTASNTDCIEISTLAYNIAIVALFLGSTVLTFAVLVDLKPWCPLMFRQLGDCWTRYMWCAVPSFELSDLLCCWSRHIIQQVSRCFIWVLVANKPVVNILGSPYQSHLQPMRTTCIKILCRSLLRPYTVKVEIEKELLFIQRKRSCRAASRRD